ncbi:MAG: hypothetical protein RL637_887 [Pseudomonadota bacterium]|jgi:hypothetical protein
MSYADGLIIVIVIIVFFILLLYYLNRKNTELYLTIIELLMSLLNWPQ